MGDSIINFDLDVFPEVACVPAYPDELRPYVGMKFHSLDEGIAYGRETGFDRGIEMDEMHAQEGFITKRRRTSKRLGEVHMRFIWDCTKANIGPTMTFKFLNEFLGGYDTVGINVAELSNYVQGLKTYVEGSDAQILLDEMARKKKACPDFTYQYCMIFSPFTGKDYHGKPVTFGAALLSNETTESYSWLFKHFLESMGQAPKMIVTDQDRGMRAAIRDVLVDTKHRWCMWHIMLKLTDKIPRRSLENEELKKEISACVWSEVLEPEEFEDSWMGIMERYELLHVEWFVTMFDDREMWVPAYFRDFPMGSLIRTTSVSESENSFYKTFTRPRSNLVEFIMNFDHALAAQRNSSSKLDYMDSTIIPPFSSQLVLEKHAATKYTDHMFKRVQREIVDALHHCSTDGLLKDDVLEISTIKDKYSKSWVVTYTTSEDSYSCSCKLFGREGILCSHIFLVFKNRFLKVIPDKYFHVRWLKTALADAIRGPARCLGDPELLSDPNQLSKNKVADIFFSYMKKFDGDSAIIDLFSAGIDELGKSLMTRIHEPSSADKDKPVKDFYFAEKPAVVRVHPPSVVSTKGSKSDSKSRLVSAKEKTIKLNNKPLRQCKKCGEFGHHDSRNCGRQKGK
ncbi:protein FAR1-RELATED SEQUENCE 5-like [Salvia hispanica]|uniref:protein FAR1-RELATED SEQUENCE 5-like n=1 Tax=Salvia hispanica TaxID=49212 RepID=UPI0020090D0C|nr:protein FAR1-RELATED SEQUENCE 5-like [Salvia hispanica]